jgi:riboflavin synthase
VVATLAPEAVPRAHAACARVARGAARRRGVSVWFLPRGEGGVSLEVLLARLAREDRHDVLVEGGPTLGARLADAGLVDELWLFVAPKLLGEGAKAWGFGARITRRSRIAGHGTVASHSSSSGFDGNASPGRLAARARAHAARRRGPGRVRPPRAGEGALMFTGLVEETGTVERTEPEDGGRRLVIAAPVVGQGLGVGDSVSVNGCCQTVVAVNDGSFETVAVPETLRLTNLGALVEGDEVNLERPVRLMDRLGGHLVQGHVDGVGRVRAVTMELPGVRLAIDAPFELLRYVAHKGSIALDGVSLTVASVDERGFTVAIIPHTLGATIVRRYRAGSEVNLEVDLLARYLERLVKEES